MTQPLSGKTNEINEMFTVFEVCIAVRLTFYQQSHRIMSLKVSQDYYVTTMLAWVVLNIHDQLQVYSCIGQKGMKWWKRVFWRLCEIAVLNSYVLHNIVHGKSRKMPQKLFRLQLAYSLTGDLIALRANPPDDAVGQGPGRRPPPLPRLLGKHFPSKSHVRHRCKVCAKQKNPGMGKVRDTKTLMYCEKCSVHLCFGDCFALFHTRANI